MPRSHVSMGCRSRPVRGPSYPLYDRWVNEERVGRHLADLIQITDPTLLSAGAKQGFVANYVPGQRTPYRREPEGGRRVVYAEPRLHGHRVQSEEDDPESEKRSSTRRAGTRWPIPLEGPNRHGDAGVRRQQLCLLLHVPDALKDKYGKPCARWPPTNLTSTPARPRCSSGSRRANTRLWIRARGLAHRPVHERCPGALGVPGTDAGSVTTQSISAHAPHPNAARLFQEWSVTGGVRRCG